MSMKIFKCPKCEKRLANRQSTTTPSIDITATKVAEKKVGGGGGGGITELYVTKLFILIVLRMISESRMFQENNC